MQNKVYKVTISKRASDLLVHQVAFMAQVSKPAAHRLKQAFTEGAKSLQSMPQRCPRVSFDDITYSNYRKLIFADHYIILYQIIGDTVHVEYVVDARQDYQWMLG